MLDALERHPTVRLSLHYTGPLLEWLGVERPEFLERLRELAADGRVELMGGGLYEPVLAALPERDRIDQLVRMADTVERIAGVRPRGAWLAERVWEPDLPTSLAAAGYRWTILDDQHFRAASIPEDRLWGAYTTDDQGALLTVFGTEQGLRYGIPFGPVEDVIEHLRANATEAGDRLGTMGDDGEKFGAWPTTYEHCWGDGRWVDRFFEQLEANRDWLTTVTPSDWLERHPPIGRVYVPTSSYAEMGEWALPPDEHLVFSPLLHRAVEERRPEARWLRGGFWRTFQVRYREINDLHKQMLRASDRVATLAPGVPRELAADHLHRGQSNDCYWHGLFGGIYISHMRLATLEHLIAAEDLADGGAAAAPVAELRDVDLDGIDEAFLADPGQVVTVKLDVGAGIGSWDVRAVRHALAAAMRRRPEASHDILRRHADATPPAGGEPATEGGAASIHELVIVKEPGLADRLWYDDHERRSGLVRFLAADATPDAVERAAAAELGDLVGGRYDLVALEQGSLVVRRDGTVRAPDGSAQPVTVAKRVRLAGGRLDPVLELEVAVEHRGDRPLEGRLATEWSLHLLGGGGNPDAWYEVAGERSPHDGSGTADDATRLAFGNDHVGLRVDVELDPPQDAWWHPIETISSSEAGFERVYQGSSLLLGRIVRLEPGASAVLRVTQRLRAARDRTADELAAAGGSERGPDRA